LQYIYFLPSIRGNGLAKKLALLALELALDMGFKRFYLETTDFLNEAICLYEHLGFQHIDYELGCTGHVDCEVRMIREL
ncbi:GNAT family N-acetyltransferase, partial [Escherichia coli]|uniref:GNAT family N-acetyltransferase n=1 Tax=Escherichia coli TaxID=562 RepID=UPI002FBEF39B